jgi:hypothetical protein
MTKQEFIDRFVARMLKVAGPTFDEGDSIEEYAREVSTTYWKTPYQRAEGPEACADADMSYWGE